MRVVVQRVASASVEVDGKIVAAIGPGLLVLAGLWMSGKLSRLRIFDDPVGVMNRGGVEAGGLAVSQFTLLASMRKGNRSSWRRAALRVRCSSVSCGSLKRTPGAPCQPAFSAPTCRCVWSMTGR
jgi:D-Tyr-tRNAtyr deacylase